jgi:hypothetical protein
LDAPRKIASASSFRGAQHFQMAQPAADVARLALDRIDELVGQPKAFAERGDRVAPGVIVGKADHLRLTPTQIDLDGQGALPGPGG